MKLRDPEGFITLHTPITKIRIRRKEIRLFAPVHIDQFPTVQCEICTHLGRGFFVEEKFEVLDAMLHEGGDI